ncbi:HET domain-containing protein [Microdochium nivale]|nr:HET domain-containing protein [Microdochium nivale]
MSTPYQSLPKSGAHTRLLRLSPVPPSQDSNTNLNILASLCVINLDEPGGGIDFTAISYTWETSPATAQICFPDGASLPLTHNLVDLITVLLQQQVAADGIRSTTPLHLWIDALCINQQDVEERASQVNLMGRIYSSAQQVIAWLGKSSQHSKAAYTFMRFVSSTNLSHNDLWDILPESAIDCGFRDVLATLSNPWFHRTWVIQEAALCRTVQLMCGPDAIDLATFQACVYLIWSCVPIWDIYVEEDAELRGLYSVTRTLQIRSYYQARGHVPLELLLESAFFVGATDRRDSVYGFPGICSDQVRALLPKPDYSVPVEHGEPRYEKSVEQVFREASLALLCQGHSLDVLALAGISRARPDGFPSWAVYIQHGEDVNAPFYSVDPACWNAGGPVAARPVMTTLPNRIAVVGRALDEVARVFEPFDAPEDLNRHHKLVSSMIDAWSQTRCSSREEHLARLAGDLVLGLDSRDVIIGDEVIDWFKEYLVWLEEQTSRLEDPDLDVVASGSDGESKENSHPPTHDYHQHLTTQIGGWVVFITCTGHVGIGPPAISEGDLVAIVPGCRLPLVFRDKEHAETVAALPTAATPPTEEAALHGRNGYASKTWLLVGWCYVRDLMRSKGALDGLSSDIVFELA